MKVLLIAFCEQTHPQCQGFAADDHVDKHCCTTTATDEFLAQATPLIEEIDKLASTNLEERCKKWFEANPDETECLCEGEEFVGSVWLEHSLFESDHSYDSNEEVLRMLEETLGQLRS